MYEASVQRYSNSFIRNDVHGTDYSWTLKNYRGTTVDCVDKTKCSSFGKWFESCRIQKHFPNVVLWSGGAQFAVDKDSILKRPKDSYQLIIS